VGKKSKAVLHTALQKNFVNPDNQPLLPDRISLFARREKVGHAEGGAIVSPPDGPIV
jgi:hypothetical protein